MRLIWIYWLWLVPAVFLSTSVSSATPKSNNEKLHLLVISSYHREYLWSQDTHRGLVDALIKFNYLDSKQQAETFTNTDRVTSTRAVIHKLWMDTKRKNTIKEIHQTVNRIMSFIEQFKPSLVLLGDDNATNYIGNQLLDTETPVVFWGVNGYPVKYGLLDSIERPGHNVTGIYQAGYLKEGVDYLHKLLPDLKTFAVLSDDSPTGRSKAKEIKYLATTGDLPLKLVDTVITGSLKEWQEQALALQKQVDAFFILNHHTLKDNQNKSVDPLAVGSWYLEHIKRPDVAHERQFVEAGILAAVDDSGYKQAFEAMHVAHRILQGESPATIRVYAPERGARLLNRKRAAMLGYSALEKNNALVEEYIEHAHAMTAKTAALQKSHTQ
ncbi:ABC transporter substrate-binding protein [Spartinivicinus poritis]|uniref:ABC transporter substrate binding protein n=1 Tax=Spartinivicinus poritis TaxID=2994640 RepID=A0ABT5UH00_9GAMM|nr:ABC transporter substrate binding protein [Spartinivicinus sp. A2-2]MDE1465670.1 ABC transporter substrate binding protein [Spartinivicinus sp. A2-2]